MPVCMRDNGHELGLDSCPTDRPIARSPDCTDVTPKTVSATAWPSRAAPPPVGTAIINRMADFRVNGRLLRFARVAV